jgi:molybdopterin synthase sulfur carrier subunit
MPDTSVSTKLRVRVVYLARLREALGSTGETLALPAGDAATVESLVATLRGRGGAFATELASGRAIRFAVNHRVAGPSQSIADGDEVAIFPPVTGG